MGEAFGTISSVLRSFPSQLLQPDAPPPQWLKTVVPEVICHLLVNANGHIRDRGVTILNKYHTWSKVHEATPTACRESPRDVIFNVELHVLLRSNGPKLPVRWAMSAVETLSTARSVVPGTRARQWRSRAGLLMVLSSLASCQTEDLCAALAAWSCHIPLLDLTRQTRHDGSTGIPALEDDDFRFLLHVISVSRVMSEKIDRQTGSGGAKKREVTIRPHVSKTMLFIHETLRAEAGNASQQPRGRMHSRRQTGMGCLQDNSDRVQGIAAPRMPPTKSESVAVSPRTAWCVKSPKRTLLRMAEPPEEPVIEQMPSRSSSSPPAFLTLYPKKNCLQPERQSWNMR